jgi:hypothetical protein
MNTTIKKALGRAAVVAGAALAAISFGSSAPQAATNPLAGLLGSLLGGGAATLVCQIDADQGLPPRELILNGSHVKSPGAGRLGIHELVRLTVPINGNGIGGTVFHEYLEGCTLPVSGGTLALNSAGVGDLTIVLNIGATVSDQGDMACMALFGGQTTLTETFHAVSSPTSGRLDLAGEENYAPVAGGEALVPVRGSCVRQ